MDKSSVTLAGLFAKQEIIMQSALDYQDCNVSKPAEMAAIKFWLYLKYLNHDRTRT